jgi:dTDP-4-dehydrorhamnose 3,5-epimerase
VSVSLKAFGSSILIPKGCAHGFLTKSEKATLIYNVSTVYDKNHDHGILWNSINFDWGISNPILSSRDASFQSIKDFSSPFI